MVDLNSKNKKVLQNIFAEPPLKNIAWDDAEKLMDALGAKIVNKGGSAVTFSFGEGKTITFHRPHPQKEAKVYNIKRLKVFLENIGITPN
jgi:phospholipid N-methyltransferase